jgi:DNA polymerase-3 subunit epsilon
VRVPDADARIASTEVLIIDCQTTGATPERGHLLEIAWCRLRAEELAEGGSIAATSMIVALPQGAALPRSITRLTGITAANLTSAVEPAEVWARLVDTTRGLGDRGAPAPTVAHFARFEEPFLRRLHTEQSDGGDFPFDLICTHQIAQRMLPNLPRMGLRALAGYLGRVLGKHKRAADHVEATAVVWVELVARLEAVQVTDFDSLRAWLRVPPPPRLAKRQFPMSRAERLALPEAPGVYRMVARDGSVLYVGKATSLKRRFNSYFQKRKHGNTERVLELLTQTRRVEVTETGSPLEAAILETDEIKRLAPPYNTALVAADERVWFASADLRSLSPQPNDNHPLGPLPRPDSMDGLRLVRSWLKAGSAGDARELRRSSLLPEALPVDDTALLDQGFELFRQRHESRLHDCSTTALFRLGVRLWREMKAAQSQADDGAEHGSTRETWEPEDVAILLEGVVCQGSRLVRRAHMICQLAESALIFRPRGAASGARRLLLFERGRLERAEDGEAGTPLPLPSGHGRPWRERQAAFDAATYDRLRVVTTDLRRLLAEGQPVRCRLGPRGELGPPALSRRLELV